MEIVICILAGGKSSRMGKDKCKLKIGELTFLDFIIKNLEELNLPIYISSRGEKDFSNRFKKKVILDELGTGPIAGLYKALTLSEKVILVPCDMPLVEKEIIDYLIRRGAKYDLATFRIRGYLQPQLGIYSKRCLPIIKENIKKGINSLRSLYKIKELNSLIIDEEEISGVFDLERVFLNINREEDYNCLMKIIKGRDKIL